MIALTRALGILLLMWAVSSTPSWASEDQPVQKTVVVRKGDTLTKLAKRHAVKVEDLRRWNRGRIGKNDAIDAGEELVVQPGKAAPKPKQGEAAKAGKSSKKDDAKKVATKAAAPIAPPPGMWEDQVVIRRGDSLGRIASRAGVELASLMTWNGLGERSKIRAGQRLRVFRPGPRPAPQSVGRPTAGTMTYGQHLGTGPGYRLRFPKNAYGLDGVLKTLRTCAKRVRDNLPGSHDILIGDISRPGGGPFPPHQSHQSGRDVDVGYYLASQQQNATMHRVAPEEVDYPRTWALLKCYLTTDEVVRVYIDRGIQAKMADWLRSKRLVDEGELQRLFQTVGGDEALILHAKKHDTHLHIRFACDAGQPECVEESGNEIFDL